MTLGPQAEPPGVSPTDATAAPVLACHGLVKRFPGVLALDDVDLEVTAG